jgi:DMSO reductase family type II enzyme chaperone
MVNIEVDVAVPLLRSAVYKVLSRGFALPSNDISSSISDGAYMDELKEAVSVLQDLGFDEDGVLSEPLEALDRAVEEVRGLTLEEFQSEFLSIFGYTISREYPPYETQYGCSHVFQQTQELADIAGFYKAFGLEIGSNAGERLDHISIELEYMHFLTYKEAHARKRHGPDKAEICVNAQRKFLDEHLGSWIFHYAKLFRRKIKEGFYRGLTDFMEAFISSDMSWLGIEVTRPGKTTLTPYPDSDDTCVSCPMSEDRTSPG